ncbi:xaa-Pro aminopeptidase 2-like, partial [Pyxicephalus adspersus]|uniref:xaa-Pro aminopeptidase 2-like n=1 Tax=Pyxicephalus adspersus TaxID=30357 RepID=UPI003B5C8AD5
ANREKRRQWLTGFTGSSGTAAVTLTRAAVFTDSRYWTQAERQMDCNWELQKTVSASAVVSWILEEVKTGEVVGFDPFLLSINEWESYSNAFEGSGRTLHSITTNLVNTVWGSQRINNGLFNLRAQDIPNNPYFYSYSLLTKNSISLFLNTSRITSTIRNYLNSNCPDSTCVQILEYDKVRDTLIEYVKGDVKVWIGSQYTNYGVYEIIPKAKLLSESYSPVMMTKAVKTEKEQRLLKNCHIRDAVAVIEYLLWLEKTVPTNTVTELSGASFVDGRRAKQEYFKGPSFTTISASGLNAALPHYRATNECDRRLSEQEIYLVDSGGQYFDGTTDITRTVHWGTPSAFEKEAYTRVLIGNIELSQLVFPPRALGINIESIARRALWEAGLNFGHGTGHGIGNFFSVHEWPVGLRAGNVAFTKGMFTSIEPGYYHEGYFGIRIEDIAVVVEADTKYTFGGEKYLTFEKVTLVPYDRNLIDTSLMTDVHLKHIEKHYEKIRQIMLPELQRQGLHEEYKWLEKNTEPLSPGNVVTASLGLLSVSFIISMFLQ